MNKSSEQFLILFIISVSLIAAIALAEFLKWTDDKPEIRTMLYLD